MLSRYVTGFFTVPCSKQFQRRITLAMAEVTALTLANTCFDVQISICMFLHPSDILALRKVCRPEVFVAQISELLLSRLVKLFNVAHGNV